MQDTEQMELNKQEQEWGKMQGKRGREGGKGEEGGRRGERKNADAGGDRGGHSKGMGGEEMKKEAEHNI